MKYADARMEIDIVRDTFTALKATAWKDFKDVLLNHGLYNSDHHNKTDHIYNLNGNFINYYGADNPNKIHGRARDILWVNEAHQFPPDIIDQLFPRTRQRIICDYNPAIGEGHWLDDLIDKYGCLITTYRDNPHLTRSQILEIESRKHDPYWWKVYGTGERSSRQGVVFTNWDVGEFDLSLPHLYGLDLGYSPNPSGFVRIAVDHKKRIIYADEQFYLLELGIDALAAEIKNCLLRPNDLVVSDVEKRTIADLKARGVNIKAVVKGPGSVISGLRRMLEYKLVVTARSKNLIMELNNYVWSDKKSDTPIKENDHLIDPTRYGFEEASKRPGKKRRAATI